MSAKLLSHRAALSNMVSRIAGEAGVLILDYFDGLKDMKARSKEDGSPVTLADQEAERLIEDRLSALIPGIPIIGEEAYSAGCCPDLQDQDYFWLVDPLDGTRAFVRGQGDFTVNIGLVYHGDPVLGIVYAPEKGELYAGFLDEEGTSGQATRFSEESGKENPLRTRKVPRQGLTVMASGDYGDDRQHEEFLKQYKVSSIIRRASSLKICAIAVGKADLYVRFGPTGEWDTAAGHAILRASGGDIRDMKGRSLRYGVGNSDLINPNFVAASADLFACMEQAQISGE